MTRFKTDKTEKYAEQYNLHKVPAEALLAEARKEVGQLKSEIDEKDYIIETLQRENQSLQRGCATPEEWKELRRQAAKELRQEQAYIEKNEEIQRLQKTIHQMRKDRDVMLCTISTLRKKLQEYEENGRQD